MLLSILMPAKNDNHRENGIKTIDLSINQCLNNIKTLGCEDVELVLCDWGSEKKVIDALNIEKFKYFKCVYVAPEIAKKYNKKANYSIVHPINTAFRHSEGKYVMYLDSDSFFTYVDFANLYNFLKNLPEEDSMSFFWGSKIQIPYEVYTYMNIKEVNQYVEQNSQNLVHEVVNKVNFMGTAISLLMNRGLWEDSTGWYEELTYWGWQDIEFHNRLLHKYKFGGVLYDYGIKFYHLNASKGDYEKHGQKNMYNPQLNANTFKANPETWGLNNEILEIIR